MHKLSELKAGEYRTAGLKMLKLTEPLDQFPVEILDLGDSLEVLDLSGTGLAALPVEIGSRLPKLRIAFFSNCSFAEFPKELASCPSLEIVAFRSNDMTSIPEGALPPQLRWLILTDNQLESLPASIGRCSQLQKCMLAGNQLQSLPDEMANCQKLGLLRLSSNCFEQLPEWLFDMPELAFLSFAGNPCSTGQPASVTGNAHSHAELCKVKWARLDIQDTLGEGASGVISRATRRFSSGAEDEQVAVKLFRGALTSDGSPIDEMRACIAAGSHKNLIGVLGNVDEHPDEAVNGFQGGLVMRLIPPHYQVLGRPPSFETCTRDTFVPGAALSVAAAIEILEALASAAEHLHARGIAHGDLYAHNILTCEGSPTLLGDFGAATVYGLDAPFAQRLEKLEVLAFSHLVEDVLGLIASGSSPSDGGNVTTPKLKLLHAACSNRRVQERPSFAKIHQDILDLMHP
ncbi:uncharacterized protein E0L32_003847 [Thyridium curvatum]|uniref:Protein kinase domain-containing protein n=1 Tax=Thyridium curvatum TaxID=1093900 RepID=A0A507BAB6_9PEZI|nr:uncharacterized protein E0L32_003847 [Thyridium curvatum]TPX16553.1 hypothetical protein E0L32_003847 [Thyridium curvatum]